MKNLPIGWRLSLAFALLLLLTAAVAVSGYRGTSQMASATMTMLERDAELARLADDARASALEMRRYEKDTFLTVGEAGKEAEYEKSWRGAQADLVSDLQAMLKLVDDQERARVQALQREA